MSYKKTVIQTEYTPEYQEEIERIVLGSVLIDSNVIHLIAAEFQAKLFQTEKHFIIAETIVRMHLNNSKIDLFLLVDALKKEHKLEKAGGIVYISSLTKFIGTTANIEYHLRLLQQFWLAIYINETCNEAQLEILTYKKDVFDVYSDLQMKLESAMKDLVSQDISMVGEVHNKIVKESYETISSGGVSGVPTGLNRVDLLTNGWQKTDLIIVAGRPGMGKTALALSITLKPAIQDKIPTAFFSLEMSKEQLVGRIESMKSGVDVSKIIKKQLTVDEVTHIERNCRDFNEAPLYIDDTPGISIMEFKSKARKLVREKGVQLIIIDYIQLMKSGLKIPTREAEVSEISKSVKAIAKELNVPIIALAQLSRSTEQRGGNKIPMLSDLRESGQLEQDADMIVFCHRPEYYFQDEYEWNDNLLSAKGLFMFIVAKHRNGVCGEIPLHFIGQQTMIVNHPDESNMYRYEPPTITISQGVSSVNPANSGFMTQHGSNLPDKSPFSSIEYGIDVPSNNDEFGNLNGLKIPDINNSDLDFFNGNETPF